MEGRRLALLRRPRRRAPDPVGYCLLAVAGAFVTSVDAFGSSVGPDLLAAALLAGVAYPLLFGGAGGLLATVVD